MSKNDGSDEGRVSAGIGSFGVAEPRDGFADSLRMVGRQTNGGTAVICYVTGTGLRLIPLGLRVVGLLLLLYSIRWQNPFSWIPLEQAQSFEAFSMGTWLLAVGLYMVYFVFTLFQNGMYKGEPGAEIHLSRYKKIIRCVSPGGIFVNLDPRVRPYAVVSKRQFAVTLPEVEGLSQDNITLRFRGAMVLRVKDGYRLLERGGMPLFLKQLSERFNSVVKDAMLQQSAKEFNSFMIDSVAVPTATGGRESITDRLAKLEQQNLSVEALLDYSEIDELNLAKLNMDEPADTKRLKVIEPLRLLADDYGIELVDHIPTIVSAADDFTTNKATPLVNSLVRLHQAATTLQDITSQETEQEILTKSANSRMAVLRIMQLCAQMGSLNALLKDPATRDGLIEAKLQEMNNIAASIMAKYRAKIASEMTSITGRSLESAREERFVTELQAIIVWLEENSSAIAPDVRSAVVSSLQEAVAPEGDRNAVDQLLENSGTTELLDKLKELAAEASQGSNGAEDAGAATGTGGQDEQEVNIDTVLAEVAAALQKIGSDTGVDISEFTLDRVDAYVEKVRDGKEPAQDGKATAPDSESELTATNQTKEGGQHE